MCFPVVHCPVGRMLTLCVAPPTLYLPPSLRKGSYLVAGMSFHGHPRYPGRTMRKRGVWEEEEEDLLAVIGRSRHRRLV